MPAGDSTGSRSTCQIFTPREAPSRPFARDTERAIDALKAERDRLAAIVAGLPDPHELAEEVAGSLASAGLLPEGLTARALESIILAVERCLRGALPVGEVLEPFLDRAAGGGR